MTELGDIFAYDLTSTGFLAGSMVMLVVYATAALWMCRTPATTSAFDFAPTYGL